jgi:transposase-like protein
MLGFKSFRSAAVTLAGIELMHMIRKGQLRRGSNEGHTRGRVGAG